MSAAGACFAWMRLRAVHRNFTFSYFGFMTEVSWVVGRCGQAGGCGRNFPRYRTYAMLPGDRLDILKLLDIFGTPSGDRHRARTVRENEGHRVR